MICGEPIYQAQRLIPVETPTMGVREAMSSTIARYLAGATFRLWGRDAPDKEFRLNAVFEEWPDQGFALPYPAATVIESSAMQNGAHNFVPTPLEETLGVFDCAAGLDGPAPQTVLWKLGEAAAGYQLDVWTTNNAQRDAIEAEIPHLFSPGQARSGVLLAGHPRYFGRRVRATLLSVEDMDSSDRVFANERRLRCAIRAEADIVRLYRATLLAPTVTVQARDSARR